PTNPRLDLVLRLDDPPAVGVQLPGRRHGLPPQLVADVRRQPRDVQVAPPGSLGGHEPRARRACSHSSAPTHFRNGLSECWRLTGRATEAGADRPAGRGATFTCVEQRIGPAGETRLLKSGPQRPTVHQSEGRIVESAGVITEPDRCCKSDGVLDANPGYRCVTITRRATPPQRRR